MEASQGTAPASKPSTTLENLQTAFNGESNAHACYLAFAAKADEEGYGPVASLFRAAARAEEIHAGNHAAVIKQLGAIPQAKIETPDVKSTRENLKAAIRGETYERDDMYPAFIAQARIDDEASALNTFQLAQEVEGEHARLYTGALVALESLKGAGVTYYVCPVCGFTALKLAFDMCPVCAAPAEEYEEVS